MYLIDKLVLFFCVSPLQSAMGGLEGWIGSSMEDDGWRWRALLFILDLGQQILGSTPFYNQGWILTSRPPSQAES